MPVAHGGVGDQQLRLGGHPVGDGFRALRVQQGAGAGGRLGPQLGHPGLARLGRWFRTAGGFGMPVHGDVGDVGEDLGGAVGAGAEVEQLWRRVDELGGVGVVQEGRVFQQVDDEVDVGGHAADAELAQGAVHAGDGLFGRLRPGGDLDQQRIVIAGDDAPSIGRAAIQPDAHAGGRAIGGDAAIIGDEVVLRVFGGDAALQGMAAQLHIGLAGNAGGFGQGLALGDLDLGLNDVDAGHFLGDGMFDLNPRVHLDEVELLAVHIHQELDRAGAFIADMGADAAAKVADLGALGIGQVGGGGALDNLLVAALDGAVAFIEVVDLAMAVAEDLHLDMPRAQDHLFEVTLAIAEGGLGLAPALADLLDQLLGVVDRAHPAPAAAPAGLEHQRVADRRGLGLDRVEILAEHFGRRDHRHPGLDGDAAGAGLVAKGAHGFRLGADEGDAGGDASLDEIGVLGEQAIAGVDGVGAGFACHPDDLGDREIGGDRAHALADPVGLIRLEAVQAQLVLFRVDGDGLLAKLVGGAQHPDGNLAAVGDQDLLEIWHGVPPGRCENRHGLS